MDSVKGSSIYTLFSGRSDVIRTFSRIGNPGKVHFSYPISTELVDCNFSIFLVDVSTINSLSDIEFASLLECLKDRALFIIPYDISIFRRNLIYEKSNFYVDFPIDENILKKKFDSFVEYCGRKRKKRLSAFSQTLISYNPLFDRLLGSSVIMQQTRSKILAVAKGREPILLLGESGTGKSTSAELIHKLSSRHMGVFKHENVSNIAPNLADSVFFGQEEGLYTGATKKRGLVEIVDGGTLFMDEIGAATEGMQIKLNTFMDTGNFVSVGSEKVKKADVRMIFATNEDLIAKIGRKEFREDFYFRIAHNVIHFPPLREHIEDINEIAPIIAGKKGKKLSDRAIKTLKSYYWPGNIRQLEACINQAANLANDTIIESEFLEFNY